MGIAWTNRTRPNWANRGWISQLSAAATLLAAALPSPTFAQSAAAYGVTHPLRMDSFRIGSGGGGLCQAQSQLKGAAMTGMFDRGWTVVCRDAPRAIGELYMLRDAADMDARLDQARGEAMTCGAPTSATYPDLGAVAVRQCQLASGISYQQIRVTKGRFTYAAQGFGGYESALILGLRSIFTDKLVEGEVQIATLGSADASGFARIQAQSMDPQTVMAEGYRRNNSGNYAEAAEFFDTLQARLDDSHDAPTMTAAQRTNRMHEYAINRALQLSDLGEFAQADALFAEADKIPTTDPVQLRLRRNFKAMNKLNQLDYAAAEAILTQPMSTVMAITAPGGEAVVLGEDVTQRINSGLPAARSLGLDAAAPLTEPERAAIIDAQALQLHGTILRLSGKPVEARTAFAQAEANAMAIRQGHVTSITRMRAQLLAETALTYEAEGNLGQAESLLRQAVDLLALQYPETVALNGARARLAAFLARHGHDADAITLYRQIVDSTTSNHGNLTGLYNQIGPYFALMAKDMSARPELAGDMFVAAQTLVRPGAADTVEVLSRELSGGTDEASRLFRQSVSLGRDIERSRIQIAQLNLQATTNPGAKDAAAAEQRNMDALTKQQADTLTRLAAYPQYRAVSKDVLSLDEMRGLLKPGEAYLKLAVVGNSVYAVYVDAQGATGYKAAISAGDLEAKVTALRNTISVVENGVRNTYPFDVNIGRELFVSLFGPVSDRLKGVTHLIFEPDGGMLRLPVSVLIADQAGVDAYVARTKNPAADAFDFRGIDWIGRDRAVSTSISARGFADARKAPASTATHEYLGFGENAPVSNVRYASMVRGAVLAPGVDCTWPERQWDEPISAKELKEAATLTGGAGSEVITGSAFTDTAILAKTDLDQYRILHFATHGLVTAPRKGCPARPALVTSFGGQGSDGLLQFGEIFDLHLNADLVILSACDTAGQASTAATREAGLGTGGGSALDGLVRAFIGAGGRAIIASHWPAPDEYNATERLITGIFKARPGENIGDAVHDAKVALMNDAQTSHPFYWAGFILIGDGARPLLTQK